MTDESSIQVVTLENEGRAVAGVAHDGSQPLPRP